MVFVFALICARPQRAAENQGPPSALARPPTIYKDKAQDLIRQISQLPVHAYKVKAEFGCVVGSPVGNVKEALQYMEAQEFKRLRRISGRCESGHDKGIENCALLYDWDPDDKERNSSMILYFNRNQKTKRPVENSFEIYCHG